MKKNQSILGPMHDELLHSFIFRLLYRKGYCNFSTILTSMGWGTKPSVPYSARKAFEVFSCRDLIRIFEKNTFRRKNESIFNIHFHHLLPFNKSLTKYQRSQHMTFRSTFYPESEKYNAGKSIGVKFCISCIRFQIKKYGFAYFKSDWINQSICSEHAKPLYILMGNQGVSDMRKSINQVLRGVLPTSCLELKESMYDLDDEPYLASRVLSFAPCAKPEIVKFLSTKIKHFNKGYNELVDYGFLTTQERYIFSRWRLKEELWSNIESYYEIALEQNYEDFMVFLNDKMKIINVHYIDDIAISDDRWLLKSKTLKCSQCTTNRNIGQKQCSASQLIFSTREFTAEFTHSINLISPCFEWIRLLTLNIIRHQDMLGVGLGESTVKTQIRWSELRKITGGVNVMLEMRNRMMAQEAKK